MCINWGSMRYNSMVEWSAVNRLVPGSSPGISE